MSVKHVKKYYEEIRSQYNEMLENLKDAEQELADQIVDLDYVERLKTIIKPIKDNYERWSYMMFLLNQPERKQKIPAYKQRMNKFIADMEKSNSIDAVIEENNESIKNTKLIGQKD